MRFLTAAACRTFAEDCGYLPDSAGLPTRLPTRNGAADGPLPSRVLGFDLKFTAVAAFAKAVVGTLPYYDHCLMWVTEWAIWPSSENLHLYYRLRQSYLEPTLLHEAPGHLFLGHERADLASFVQLAVLFGWGFHLLPTPPDHALFVSHDEYVVVSAEKDEAVESVAGELAPYCKRHGSPKPPG